MILSHFLLEARSWIKTLVRKHFNEGLVTILSLPGYRSSDPGVILCALSGQWLIAGPAWTWITSPYNVKSILFQWPWVVRPSFLHLLYSKHKVSLDPPVLSAQAPMLILNTTLRSKTQELTDLYSALLFNSICVNGGFKPFLETLQCCGFSLGKPSYCPFVLASPMNLCPLCWVSRHDPCQFTFLLAYSRFLNFSFQTKMKWWLCFYSKLDLKPLLKQWILFIQ